jgi:hypothetical protein
VRSERGIPRRWRRRLPAATRVWLVGWALLAVPRSPLGAQTWNDSATIALVQRGISARRHAEPDSSLTSYRTRAHGFVFFLAQVGQGLTGTPRLIKADELDVDVYWQAPALSRQVILGWRDGRWLPTDINYHRDHLGIVTNNFGDRIRIGEGDEVRDVVHPLAAEGPQLYDYRLSDSVRLQNRDTTLELYEVEVRPRDPSAPRVLGTLSLDVGSGDLVRFRFSFTPAAYLDRSLEDISVVLENARLEGRWWLPWRQEVEIRRRVSWLDFPARSIIRGRWEIGDYDLNVSLPQKVAAGPPIGGLRAPVDTGGRWSGPLADAIQDAGRPVEQQDLEAVRAEIEHLAEGRALSGQAHTRLGVSSLSDVARVNRVEGLALGAGLAVQVSPEVILRPRAAFGTSDERLTGDLRLSWERPWGGLSLQAGRRVADLADHPIVSGITNSLLAQETGRDLGDYTLVDLARLRADWRTSPRLGLSLEAGAERSRSLPVTASPANGSYRANPRLGAGTTAVLRLTTRYEAPSVERARVVAFEGRVEGGIGDREYARAAAELSWAGPVGPGTLALRTRAGAGTAELPGYRNFAIGGWGTLVGEPFRAWGGRRVALASIEYRLDAPFPAIPLGAFVSTGRTVTIAPFLSAGITGGLVRGLPWRPSGKVRPVAGLALEWFHRLIRAEAGVGLRTGALGVTVDVSREWWDIL